MSNTCRLTASQLRELLRRSLDKYKRALVEPGEASDFTSRVGGNEGMTACNVFRQYSFS